MKVVCSLLFLWLLTFCKVPASAQFENNASLEETTDSKVALFNDPAYRQTLHLFDADNDDEEKRIATLSLKHTSNGDTTTLLVESLCCG